MKKKFDYITIGFTLFAIFFGAGNLIFPPAIGLVAGKDWFIAILGFFLTGIGLPLCGVLALNKAGSFEVFGEKIGKRVSNLFMAIVLICVGPILAIPRTAATTFEMGIRGNIPITPWFFAIIFFTITALLTIKPSKIVEYVGKLLTPGILIILAILFIKGIFFRVPEFSDTITEGSFAIGFFNGYQTMDALGAPLVALVVIRGIYGMGYEDKAIVSKLLSKGTLVAAIAFLIVYGSLLYLGASYSGVLDSNMDKTILTMTIANRILGRSGQYLLGIAVSLACLTSAIGLTAVVAQFFSKLLGLEYKLLVVIVSLVSAIMSINGVESLIEIAVPLLTILYPVIIVLITFNLFGIERTILYKGVCLVVFTVTVLEVVSNKLNIPWLSELLRVIPFSSNGFAWLLPSIATILLINIFNRNKKIALAEK